MHKYYYKFDLEKLYGFFNQTENSWCEVSRAENIIRGAGIFLGGDGDSSNSNVRYNIKLWVI